MQRTAVVLDDLLAQRQADAIALEAIAAVEAMEDVEDALVVFGRDADSVVAHAQEPATVLGLRADVDLW